MVHCCIQGCKNTHHYKGRIKDTWSGHEHMQERNYSLHDLPGEDRKEIRDLWIIAINRTALPKDVAVCSDHFTEDCFDEKWEEYKRLYGPTKVKRKLKLDAVPTIFPGRIFIHEKVQRIKESWKNKALLQQREKERLRLEREYKDRFKFTQTDCTCKCRCRKKTKDFSQQVNFSFKFMEDIGIQCPDDSEVTQSVKNDHTYVNSSTKEAEKLKKKKAEDQEGLSKLIMNAISHMVSKKAAGSKAEGTMSTDPHVALSAQATQSTANVYTCVDVAIGEGDANVQFSRSVCGTADLDAKLQVEQEQAILGIDVHGTSFSPAQNLLISNPADVSVVSEDLELQINATAKTSVPTAVESQPVAIGTVSGVSHTELPQIQLQENPNTESCAPDDTEVENTILKFSDSADSVNIPIPVESDALTFSEVSGTDTHQSSQMPVESNETMHQALILTCKESLSHRFGRSDSSELIVDDVDGTVRTIESVSDDFVPVTKRRKLDPGGCD